MDSKKTEYGKANDDVVMVELRMENGISFKLGKTGISLSLTKSAPNGSRVCDIHIPMPVAAMKNA